MVKILGAGTEADLDPPIASGEGASFCAFENQGRER